MIALPVLAALVAGGCRAREVEKDLRLTDVETGWYDAGIVDGQNKLVPSVTFRIQNVSQEAIDGVQINAIFRRVNEPEMWGEYFGWAVPREPLPAGATSNTLVMRSTLGYTGEQPRMQMLQNREFIDAKVEIYLKQGSKVWAKLAEYPIQRQLLTQ